MELPTNLVAELINIGNNHPKFNDLQSHQDALILVNLGFAIVEDEIYLLTEKGKVEYKKRKPQKTRETILSETLQKNATKYLSESIALEAMANYSDQFIHQKEKNYHVEQVLIDSLQSNASYYREIESSYRKYFGANLLSDDYLIRYLENWAELLISNPIVETKVMLKDLKTAIVILKMIFVDLERIGMVKPHAEWLLKYLYKEVQILEKK